MVIPAILLLAQSGIPAALERFDQSRASIRYADIEWAFTDGFEKRIPSSTMHYRGLFAGSDVATFPRGTDGGVTGWHDDGQGQLQPTYDPPTAAMRSDGEKWTRSVDTVLSRHWGSTNCPFRVFDVRRVGLSGSPSVMWSGTAPGATFSAFDPDTQWSEEVRDQIHVVTGTLKSGGGCRYWIDPQKGWNATRVESLRGDGTVADSAVLDYSQFDGVWFPNHCEYLDEAGQSKGSVQVYSAELNTPDLPRRLTPENIGIQDGSPVVDMADGQTQKFYVDGQLLESDEFKDGLKAGRIVRGPLEQQFLANGGKLPPLSVDELKRFRVERLLDEWERYTLGFIEKYRLDTKQRREAFQILRRCQTDRDERMPKIRRELEQLGSDDKSVAKRAALLAPVERIFDERLKPALFKLPSAEQIVASGDPEKVRERK